MFLPGWWRNPKSCRVARLRLFAGRGPMMAWRFPTSHSGNWHFFSLGGILRSHGTVENTIQTFLTRTGVNVRPITAEVAALATQFPESYPRDPVDRLIGATARAEGLALVTRDEMIRNSPLLKTIW